MERLTRFVDGIIGVLMKINMIVIVIMMVMIAAESVLRTFFSYSMMIVDEFSGYLLMASVFLSLGFCMRSHSLLRVTIVYDRLPDTLRNIFQVFFDLISLVFVLILNYQLCRLVANSYKSHVLSISQAQIPLWIPQTIMPIGITVLILAMIIEIIGNIQQLKNRSSSKCEY
jgi:TRAP-type C4-dicarboxylate transport system permease small subunit